MKKRYEVKGMMEWHPMFVAGRARVRVSFTGGHLGEGCVTPACFETSDPVVQRLIEKSSAFRSGRIRPGACSGTDEAQASGPQESLFRQEATSKRASVSVRTSASERASASEAEAEAASASAGEAKLATIEFASMEEAREYLNMNRQVRMSRLLDVESCKREARKLGLEIKVP